jgi:tetratricopeptide (TPR) repeat protein
MISRIKSVQKLKMVGCKSTQLAIGPSAKVLKTEGVPFFIEEFTRSLQESGSLKKTNRSWCMADELSNISIPETLQDLLMSRVDRLPENVKEVLQLGSVIERKFSWSLIKETTELDDIDLLSRLSHLKEAELIIERGIFPQVNYIFQHALTRELVYKSLLETKRKTLHLRIAKTMERLYADRMDEHFPILALHFTWGGDTVKGYSYHHRAGDSAARAYANQEALEHFRHAWSLIDQLASEQKPDQKRLETAIKLAQVMETLGEFEPTISLLKPVLDSSRGKQNPEQYAGIHYWLGHTFGNLGQYGEARKYLHCALELSQKAANMHFLGNVNDYLGQLDFFQGYLNRSMEHMEIAVYCLRKVGHINRLAWSIGFKAIIFCELEIRANWQDVVEAAAALIKSSGNERAGCLLYQIKSRNSHKIGQYDEALKYALDGLELAENIGERIQKPFLLNYAAIAALYSERGEYALELVQKAENESVRVGHPLGKSFSRVTLAEVLLHLNKFEAARHAAQTCLQFCQKLDLGWILLMALDVMAEILSHCTPPDKEQIKSLMVQSEYMVERIDAPWFRINHLISSARTSIRLKDLTAARSSLEVARTLYRECGLKNGTARLQAVEREIEDQISEAK